MKKLIATLLCLAAFCAPALAQKSKANMTSEINSNLADNAVGGITPQIVRTTLNDMVTSYQQYGGVNPQVGTTYTVGLSDYGQLVTFTNSASIAVTLPQGNGSFASFNFYASTLGAGTVTITPQGGSTINGLSTLTLLTGQSAWIVSDGSNYQTFKGTGTAGSGSVTSVVIAGGTGITPSGTCTITVSGTCTINLASIGNNAVLGNVSGVSAAPVALTTTQMTTLCNTFTSLLSGCVAASGGGTSAFLRADGSWTAPSGSGSVNAGTAGNLGYYATSANAISPLTTLNVSGGDFTVGVAGATVGTLAFANATSGSIKVTPPTGALGSAVLTLPDATDTLMGKATTDDVTNKKFNTGATGNVLQINSVGITDVSGTGGIVCLTVSCVLTTPSLGVTTWTGSLKPPMRVITAAGSVTVSASTDYFICVNKTSGAATTVNLPAGVTALTFLVKDCKGDASSNPITIVPASGNIDGAATYVISTSRGSVAVSYDGSQWEVN